MVSEILDTIIFGGVSATLREVIEQIEVFGHELAGDLNKIANLHFLDWPLWISIPCGILIFFFILNIISSTPGIIIWLFEKQKVFRIFMPRIFAVPLLLLAGITGVFSALAYAVIFANSVVGIFGGNGIPRIFAVPIFIACTAPLLLLAYFGRRGRRIRLSEDAKQSGNARKQ